MTLNATSPAPLVAMLRPRSGQAQWIVEETYEFEPFVPATEYVDCFGNLCQRLGRPVGGLHLKTQVTVEVADEIAVKPGAELTSIEDLPDSALQFFTAEFATARPTRWMRCP